MRQGPLAAACALAAGPAAARAATTSPPGERVVLAIHGGIGDFRGKVGAEDEREYTKGLEAALKAGYAALTRKGGTPLDGVEAAVRSMEDGGVFNAGKGAVYTIEGKAELDASIMDGRTMRAGAVANVTVVKNPVRAARAVMEGSPHVLLAGPGAEAFAAKAGLEIVPASYFRTEKRWRQINEIWRKAKTPPPPGVRGTVGAVALGADGTLAAATSTGGLAGKLPGRVGDSPIIGAGTLADDSCCAVSATGNGEYFIRFSVARDIAALIKYKGMAPEDAAREVLSGKVKPAGGEGGVIILTPEGRFASSFNADPVRRGTITDKGKIRILLYED